MEKKVVKRSRKKVQEAPVRGFYDTVVENEALLEKARQMEGLDEEIAVLRLYLRTAIDEQPENASLILKTMGLLVRAIAAKYRTSEKAKEQLSEAIAAVLEEIGVVLGVGSQDSGVGG